MYVIMYVSSDAEYEHDERVVVVDTPEDNSGSLTQSSSRGCHVRPLRQNKVSLPTIKKKSLKCLVQWCRPARVWWLPVTFTVLTGTVLSDWRVCYSGRLGARGGLVWLTCFSPFLDVRTAVRA